MKNRRFELAGHTDDVGSEPYNMILSKRRANAARDYLLERFAVDPETVRSAATCPETPTAGGVRIPLFETVQDLASTLSSHEVVERLLERTLVHLDSEIWEPTGTTGMHSPCANPNRLTRRQR